SRPVRRMVSLLNRYDNKLPVRGCAIVRPEILMPLINTSISNLGSRGAVMGDSLTALALDGSNWTDRGYAAFLRRFMGSQINLPASNVFATGGDTTAQILSTWVVPCVAAQPDWCIVEAGVNDLLATSPAIQPATTIANLKAIYTVLISAGIYVIAIPIRS